MQDHAGAEQHAVQHAGATQRAQYVVVFAVLAALTLVELGVSRTAGISHPAAVTAFIAIALAKAALIALFYMHLRFETGILRATVLVPLVAPVVYGVVLIAEATARMSP